MNLRPECEQGEAGFVKASGRDGNVRDGCTHLPEFGVRTRRLSSSFASSESFRNPPDSPRTTTTTAWMCILKNTGTPDPECQGDLVAAR